MKRHTGPRVVVLLLCAFVLTLPFSAPRAASSSLTGVVVGTIVDASGAIIPGAVIALEQPPVVVATTVSDARGEFRFPAVAPGLYTIRASLPGFKTATRVVTLNVDAAVLNTGPIALDVGGISESISVTSELSSVQTAATAWPRRAPRNQGGFNTEQYAAIVANPFRLTADEPLSTFAADVDTASYANVRRFLREGRLPPPDAVRIEELVNYFRFSYPGPTGTDPVSITTEVGPCPWAPSHRLALVGVKARAVDERTPRRRNIVLLIDVSGSMASADKLPLLQTALRMFADTLRADDRLAIVVYAGASGLVLPSTAGSDRARIHAALADLSAGGSTNGAAGITLAYETARAHFIEDGINRVILATDGDFNVGVTSQGDLVRLIERERERGVFLSVLGVGTGNLKDSTMEQLADKGNGNYAYLDSLLEAQRVLVREGGALLETVAKDVKFQVEFNPSRVAAWKLIGYENRLLAHEDFNDNKKDGGELGAGHTVTVLYEIVPPRTPLPSGLSSGRAIDPLKYQSDRTPSPAGAGGDLMTVKVRYKEPAGSASRLVLRVVRDGGPAAHVPFAAAVAEFGLLLRDGSAASDRWDELSRRARALASLQGVVADREDFADLVDLAARLARMGQSLR